jgi:competence protein ComEC
MGKRLPRPLWIRVPVGLLLTSICAELALFPVGALSFARVTFAGLVLNFLAIPLMGVAQVAGMLVLPLSAVSQTVAGLAGYLAHLGADGLVRSATLVDYAPWSSYRLPPPGLFVVFGYYLGWTMWLWLRSPTAVAVRGRWRRVMSRLAAAAIVGCGLWVLVEPMTLLWPGVSGRLRVTVLDVGHGDAILVQLPDRRSVLVDAGGSMTGGSFDLGGRVVAPALWSLGTRRLDALVISHADPDHIGGAASILRDFRPREIWEAVPVAKSPLWQALRRDADGARIAWHSRHAGDVVVLGDVRCRVWHPPPPEWERPRPRNDDSLVMELEYGEVSIVLPGDIGRPVESVLARESWPRRLRVLKVPHHGSATSSLPEFLGGLAPTLAILSAGATTKVSDDVLRRYTELGATMLRTDVDGAITLETDGRTITVTTFTGRRLSVDGTTKNTKVTKGVERVDSTRRSVGLQPTARKTGRNCCPALGNRSSHR